MVKQYGHFLFVKGLEDSKRDDNGDWIPVNSDWSFHSVCREETNGKGATIQGADGKALVFSSLIQLPKNTPKVPEGSFVLVSDVNDPTQGIRIQGQVKKFDNGQLHCRIWV